MACESWPNALALHLEFDNYTIIHSLSHSNFLMLNIPFSSYNIIINYCVSLEYVITLGILAFDISY